MGVTTLYDAVRRRPRIGARPLIPSLRLATCCSILPPKRSHSLEAVLEHVPLGLCAPALRLKLLESREMLLLLSLVHRLK